MAKAKIVGIGSYAPGAAIDNLELKKLANIEFDEAKTESKLGIHKRHIAKLRGIEETTADFATNAAQNAIDKAGIKNEDVDLFIVGTDTPEYISPATALILQGRLQKGETGAMSFDISASCASFTTAYDTASRMLAADESKKYAVVVGVYNMPVHVKDGDVAGYTIFADGAGAVVLERTEDTDDAGYINGQFATDGTQFDFVGIYTGGTKQPFSQKHLEDNNYGLQFLQRLPADRNVKLWPAIAKQLVAKAGMEIKDVDHFIFTQINRAPIVEVMEILERPMSDTTCVMDKYGYTGSGCIPMALEEAVNNGSVKKGDTVMMIASGAGFAVGANLIKY